MKQRFLSILLLFSIVGIANAQSIKTKKIDKFTKQEIIETSKEALYKRNLRLSPWCNIFECSIRKVNDSYTMPANILMGDIVKYTKTDGVTFLLSNDETLTLGTLYTGIGSEKFAGGYWFRTVFPLSSSAVEKLKNNDVISIRVTYLGGSFDRDLKRKKQNIIAKMLKLVDNTK